ncbi:unnamed protein product, partial [marine sediment metagenome]
PRYNIKPKPNPLRCAWQTAFLACFLTLVSLRKLKKQTRFAPWLAAICRNVAKDMVATKVRQISTKDFSQAARNNTDENAPVIRRAIEQLPVSAKELVVLRYYNGLS